jgi:thymidylate synthase (FAD)
MSSDLGVVNAARVSFSKKSDWIQDYTEVMERDEYGYGIYNAPPIKVPKGEPYLSNEDTKLINYLAEHGHWLPFRHPHVSFHCKAPIFVARQAGKHQVGMDWSEVSRRYVDTEPEFFVPDIWRDRAKDKKQGSLETGTTEDIIGSKDHNQWCLDYYQDLLDSDVAPEQARMVLPQSMYTEWVWTGSLLAWAHFIKLRTHEHAQKEIQDFAAMFVPTLEELYPVSWKALMKGYTP